MDTARNGAGRLVEHANRQGPWLAPGQRSLAAPGIREFWIRYFVNSDSTSQAERSASYLAQAASAEAWPPGTPLKSWVSAMPPHHY